MREKMTGFVHKCLTDEQIVRRIEQLKSMRLDENIQNRLAVARREAARNPQLRNRRSVIMKRLWLENPKLREKAIANLSTANAVQSRTLAMKRFLSDPENIKQRNASIRLAKSSPDYRMRISNLSKAYWKRRKSIGSTQKCMEEGNLHAVIDL